MQISSADGIEKNIEMPYLSQVDNRYEPYTACNITCIAMCLLKYKIKGDGSEKQLEDQIYNKSVSRGWNRFSPNGIKGLIEVEYGLKDDLNVNGTIKDIYSSIDRGRPIIIHGYFTSPGHIIIIKGYTNKGHFVVHDPWGEMIAKEWRYDVNNSENSSKGKDLIYSKWLVGAACGSWSSGEAKVWYQTINQSELIDINNMWIHSVYP